MTANGSSQQVSAARVLAAQGNQDAISLVALIDSLKAPIRDSFKKTERSAPMNNFRLRTAA
jgi:hypothetical protein